jgi:DNA-binding transcriptional ArsR family regulator
MENPGDSSLEHIIQKGVCTMEDIEGSRNLIRSLEEPIRSGAIRITEKKLRALSDLTRLKIFLLLRNGEKCVCEIEYLLNMHQSSVSRNLGILENSDLITKRKSGKWTYYRIGDESFGEFVWKTCFGE